MQAIQKPISDHYATRPRYVIAVWSGSAASGSAVYIAPKTSATTARRSTRMTAHTSFSYSSQRSTCSCCVYLQIWIILEEVHPYWTIRSTFLDDRTYSAGFAPLLSALTLPCNQVVCYCISIILQTRNWRVARRRHINLS